MVMLNDQDWGNYWKHIVFMTLCQCYIDQVDIVLAFILAKQEEYLGLQE